MIGPQIGNVLEPHRRLFFEPRLFAFQPVENPVDRTIPHDVHRELYAVSLRPGEPGAKDRFRDAHRPPGILVVGESRVAPADRRGLSRNRAVREDLEARVSHGARLFVLREVGHSEGIVPALPDEIHPDRKGQSRLSGGAVDGQKILFAPLAHHFGDEPDPAREIVFAKSAHPAHVPLEVLLLSEALDPAHGGRFDKPSVGLARSVATEASALGVGRRAVDPGRLQKIRVHDRRMAVRAPHENGSVRGDAVEVEPRGRAVFLEQTFVVAPGLDPGAFGEIFCLADESPDEILDREYVGRQRRERRERLRDVGGMRVLVGEKRRHEAAREIDLAVDGSVVGDDAPRFDDEGFQKRQGRVARKGEKILVAYAHDDFSVTDEGMREGRRSKERAASAGIRLPFSLEKTAPEGRISARFYALK